MDTWGNVKIPMMESLNTSSTSDGWHAVDANSSVYSSLIGIPVSAVADRANTTFSLETSYWALDCPRLEEYGNDTRDTDNYDWIEAQDYSWALKTERIADNSSRYLALTSNTNDPPPRNWVYFSYDDTDNARMSYAECTMRTRHVEVQVHCKGRSCEVVRMRDSTLPHLPSGWTFLDDSHQNTYIFTLNLQQAVMANMFTPSAVQRYFTNPGSPFNTTAKMPRLYTVGPKSFAISFAQLLNTFWLAGIGAFVVPGGIPHSDSNLGNGTNVLQATNAVMSESEEILVCDKRWLATLLVSTSAMFIAGVVGLALGFVRRGPDLAMDIATMTRDNPYMNLPQGGSALDCAERSRLLRNIRVRFGDVTPHGEVGYAAIGSLVDEKEVDILKEERLYA
ncbi:hypothetical protein W97_00979 [Coniosporium apollinis CBS 100218]|uniref:Uncharacterized protein n=1 Tax=Coniosporium apollinis (strain CBS 100218) TaxID=1168221 RepID=R7YIP9_CONA1|nr:uncharacterized protein W97_00979 [Coniosporium apollinis CBS 100218]EON61763.1 hypothetical protein W97_00979 [Coniosporium apollinis CBS 100218]